MLGKYSPISIVEGQRSYMRFFPFLNPYIYQLVFILLFSIIILHDPYFHEITFPINAGYDKFLFVFDEPNIFVIIVLDDW
jgi:hypothetical protein